MKAWIGRWLVGVALLHTALSLAVFHEVFASVLGRGVVDTVGNDAATGLAVWCVLFGGALLLCGLSISALERASPGAALPKPLGWGLLALALVGVALMPASGFWLAIPPALAVLVRKGRACPAAGT